MSAGRPIRATSRPVTKDGANIATRCHWITAMPASAGAPAHSMARGVAVISSAITA